MLRKLFRDDFQAIDVQSEAGQGEPRWAEDGCEQIGLNMDDRKTSGFCRWTAFTGRAPSRDLVFLILEKLFFEQSLKPSA